MNVSKALAEIKESIKQENPDYHTVKIVAGGFAEDNFDNIEKICLKSGTVEELIESNRLLNLPIVGWQGGGTSYEILIDD